MLKLREGQLPILAVNLAAIVIFTVIFGMRGNYEFLMYVGVIVFFLIVILLTNHRVNYPNSVLVGLTVWAILHMAGGGVLIHGGRLYELILIRIVGEPFNIFRYDQFVHIVGFGAATLAMYYLIEPNLKEEFSWISLFVIVSMAGLGIGALNEIIEFVAVVLIPETGVGGFYNASLDLVADLIGAVFAMFFIFWREKC